MLRLRFSSAVAAGCLVALLLATSCSEDEPTAPGDKVHTPTPSFEHLQTTLFAQSCALSGCHAGPDPVGGLSLQEPGVYERLIGVDPDNAAARADGLKRVVPGKPDSSFLFIKLQHIHNPAYGARMPLGSHALSAGQMEFIRTWIETGASKTDSVADPALLNDHGTGEFHPPAPPAHGFQIHLPPFTVDPHSEREIYFMKRAPNTKDVYVTKFEVAMRDNSHHFILYRNTAPAPPPEGVVREFNPEMTDFLHLSFMLGSQEAMFSYQLPEGVGVRLPAHAALDMNSHYVNAGSAPILGEAYINIHTQDEPPARLAQSFLFSDNDLFLPPHQTTTYKGRIEPYQTATQLLMLTSHMHKRGKLFRIYKDGGMDDGKLLYESSHWNAPKVVTFDPPLQLNKGETLRYEVTYENETSSPITFGFTSEDEMCVIVGYHVPLQ